MRKPFICGNWKMNKTISQGLEFLKELDKIELNEDVEYGLAVPFTMLNTLASNKIKNLKICAQNMHFEDSGAYTGEVSIEMLKEIGVDYVVIGHSERRQYFAETDETVNKKVLKAIDNKIYPILCVGESLEQRESGSAKEVVLSQVDKALDNVCSSDLKNIVIAYEPIWAIGTGKTASSDDANDMIKAIRDGVAKKFDTENAQKIRIQYGGSVKPANVAEIMGKSDIDGALVGGASLKADDFAKLVNY